ncbi:hypothetical protein GCM10027020_09650 [Nocardioides salsibiostraticola]
MIELQETALNLQNEMVLYEEFRLGKIIGPVTSSLADLLRSANEEDFEKASEAFGTTILEAFHTLGQSEKNLAIELLRMAGPTKSHPPD